MKLAVQNSQSSNVSSSESRIKSGWFWVADIQLLFPLIFLILNFFLWPSLWQFGVIFLISAGFYWLYFIKPILGSRFITVLLLAVVLLQLAYLSQTPFDLRAHDVGGHVDYIKFISIKGSLPEPWDCWQCYHPPFYYILASIIGSFIGFEPEMMIFFQIFSLVMFFCFLIYGIKILKLFIPSDYDEKYFNLASALFTFWPAGILASVTINNDVLLYLLATAGLYYAFIWYVSDKIRFLVLSTLLITGAVFTKSNGFLFAGFIFFLITLKLFSHYRVRSFFSDRFRKLIAINIILLAVYMLGGGNNTTEPGFALVTNSGAFGADLRVGRQMSNLLFFDVKDFVTVPFVSIFRDVGGRQYLFNFLLKTSLFGEYSYDSVALRKIAIFMSYSLFMLVLVVISGILLQGYRFIKNFPSVIPDKNEMGMFALPLLVILLGAMVYFRFQYPFVPSGDFRYILPAIIPFVYLVVLVPINLRRWNNSLQSVGGALDLVTFGFASVINMVLILFIFYSIFFYFVLLPGA